MHHRLMACVAILTAMASPAAAQQHFPFERSFDVSATVAVDVSTLGGPISMRSGPAGKVVVRGVATVRVAFNAPFNAVELAKQIAANPPINREGDVIRLRPPSDSAQRRAATVSYEVIVPPGTRVDAKSDSGAIDVTGLSGPAALRTQSSRISVSGSTGAVTVASGSGAISVDRATAGLIVTTSSSAIDVRDAGGIVRIRTQSGAVNADVAPTADLDVETGSSAITLSGARRRLAVRTQSGAVKVTGHAGGAWDVNTGSGRIELTVSRAGSARFALSNRSGAIDVPTGFVKSVDEKHRVEGTLGDGVNLVSVESGSGAIALRYTL